METEFKISFFGYDPASVKDLLKRMHTEHSQKIETLRKQLADETHYLELLKVEVQQVRSELDAYKSLEEGISQALARAQLEAAQRVYNSTRDAEQMERVAAEKVIRQKNELTKLKTTMKTIREEISSMTKQYRLLLEKTGGGGQTSAGNNR